MPEPPYHIILDGSVIRPPFSGVHRAVREQLAALPAAADPSQYTFTLLARDPVLLEKAESLGVRAVAIPGLTRRVAVRVAWQQFVLPRRLRSARASLLFAPAYTAPLRCPVPYVLQVHDVIALDAPELCGRLNGIHMRRLLPGSVRRARAILTPSRYTAARVLAWFPEIEEGRVTAVPLGVGPEFFSAASGEAPPREWRDCLLFVGNIEPKKGVDVLLAAYAACARELARPLVIVGRAAWKSRALRRAIERYDGPGRVYWAGRVSDARLLALYRAAWVLVFPSWEEGFGMPVLEAMAAGLPVVHSDAPALVETAGGAGLVFPRGRPEALCAVLRGLAAAPERRRQLQEKGRARARMFSWSRWAEQALALFSRVLGADGAPPGSGIDGLEDDFQ